MITLADFKTYNGITDSTYDTTSNQCISSSIQFVNNFCNRTFESGSYTEYYNGTGNKILFLNNTPINSVDSIQIDLGGLYEFQNIFFNGGDTTTSIVINEQDNSIMLKGGYNFLKGYRNIKVTYQSGYTSSNVPQDLKMVLLEIATYFYNNSGNTGTSRFGIKQMNINSATSEGISYNSFIEMNTNWEIILNQYKRFLI